MRFVEVSPDTLAGSFSRDLVFAKLWLLRECNRLRSSYSTIYILGSWYDNMSLLIADSELQYDRIVNIDRDPDHTRIADRLVQRFGLDRVRTITGDANRYSYPDADADSLVINTSANNIDSTRWFDHIPRGVTVAIQNRNRDPGAVNPCDSLDSLIKQYPLTNLEFSGELHLSDPETPYTLYMTVGRR